MRVVFIQKDGYEKIGVQQLCSSIRQAGFAYDLFIDEFEKDFYSRIKAYRPSVVLYSLFIGEEQFMLEAFSRIKQILPGVITVAGGPFTLVFPEIIKKAQVDFLLRGEGEQTLPVLMQLLEQGESLKEIPGICFIEKHGKLFMSNTVSMVKDLRILPDPDRDIYYKYEPLRSRSTKIFITSRGCPYSCTYCYNAQLKKFYNSCYWRQRDTESVFREIEYVVECYGLKWVHFQDGTFNADKNWLKLFLNEYRRRRLPPFLCNCRVENIDEELVCLMKEAGCDRITFGIQSGNVEIRRQIAGRNMTDEQIRDAFSLCQKYKIRTGADIIFGWPGETISQAMDTIKLCRTLGADSYHSNVLIPYPGLTMTRTAVAKGFLDHEPTLREIGRLSKNASLFKQKNIKLLINMDKLFYYFIRLPWIEPLLRMLLFIPPNRLFCLLKNIHLLRRMLIYRQSKNISSVTIIKRYLQLHWGT